MSPPRITPGHELPTVWSTGRQPVDLEIGCGVGWHPIQYALQNPERRLVAIEHTREKFLRFAARVHNHRRQNLDNLLPIHADAVRWVTHHLPQASVERCFLLFPNPEPQAANKRWFRSPFMHRLLQSLKSGGQIHLATNEETYWAEAMEWAENYWNLEIVQKRSFSQQTAPAGVPRTHFEKKYLLRGETCFDFIAQKQS